MGAGGWCGVLSRQGYGDSDNQKEMSLSAHRVLDEAASVPRLGTAVKPPGERGRQKTRVARQNYVK